MSLIIEKDIRKFSDQVTPFLEKNEAENSLFLGILTGLLQSPPESAPFMALLMNDAGDVIAAVLDGKHNLIATGGWECAPIGIHDELASALVTAAVGVSGVVGPVSASPAIAQAWGSKTGRETTLAMSQRIFQLEKIADPGVLFPTPVPGSARLAEAEEVPMLGRWLLRFQAEAAPQDPRSSEAMLKIADNNQKSDRLFVWETFGEVVATASLSRETRNTITVNAVYTPEEHRRQGYATALVAAVSEVGLARGKRACVLYTDLANPTSNSIYQKIGYVPVCDSANYRFR